jgi:hypothetical protein
LLIFIIVMSTYFFYRPTYKWSLSVGLYCCSAYSLVIPVIFQPGFGGKLPEFKQMNHEMLISVCIVWNEIVNSLWFRLLNMT